MQQDPIVIVGALLVGSLAAVLLIGIWLWQTRPTPTLARSLMKEAEGTVTFLFDDEHLVDATPRAYALLEGARDGPSDWENFLALLSARFPHLRSQLSDLAQTGRKKIAPDDDQPGWIDAEFWHGLARLTLVQDQARPDQTIDPLTANAIEHELETLRGIGEDAPQLIWKRDAEGVLVWANRAYIELSEAIFPLDSGEIRPWPPQEIFKATSTPKGGAPVIEMHRIDFVDQPAPTFYEVTSQKRGTETIHFAVDATAIVNAENAQRTFVQTLTKTFAQLSVGLAIFNADRKLVLFNPALTDLTELPPDFLITRPTLFAFLDRLRDAQRMPEPKNYTSWREKMLELENAAEQGSYLESWLLPNGQTFRVSGKPHPDGAIAFLIEDISDEMSLTRKFRSQINIGSAVLNNLTSAIAVFSSSGAMVMANTAYHALWGGDGEGLLSSRDFDEELKIWRAIAPPSPVWVKLHEAVLRGKSNMVWDDTICLTNEIELACQYAALPDGHHQVTFTEINRSENRNHGLSTVPIRPSQKVSG